MDEKDLMDFFHRKKPKSVLQNGIRPKKMSKENKESCKRHMNQQNEMNSYEMKRFLFGDGPWLDELDFVPFKHVDLDCDVLRAATGHLNGYVKLPPGFSAEFGDSRFDVHGGITYCQDDVIGFDCAHMHDLVPAAEVAMKEAIKNPEFSHFHDKLKAFYEKHMPLFKKEYRTIHYVMEETKRLAEQVHDIWSKEKHGEVK